MTVLPLPLFYTPKDAGIVPHEMMPDSAEVEANG
jgi:hypothetical protein